MSTHSFKFIIEGEEPAYISAKNKGDAIKSFCKEYGVDKDYVKRHCKVVDEGEDDE